MLFPADLRSLGAVHLATACRLGQDLGAIVTYDERMAEAAMHLGHHVACHQQRKQPLASQNVAGGFVLA